jgi:hypothetical protein
MLNVFITVDTEVWPLLPDWREAGLGRDIDRDLNGVTPSGRVGVSYQIDVLNRYGLKAVFFVEPLFAEVAGLEPLRAVVAEVQGRGHEVQVHLHPEWLRWMRQPLLPGDTPPYLKDFPEEDQSVLLARGISLLRASGAVRLCAFRAGDYAANFATLRALARNGIAYDSSYNHCYFGTTCGLQTGEVIRQPVVLEGVHEFPISSFSDWPGHHRHAQLTACSFREMRTALLGAWRQGWYSFVIVSHSFELLKRRRQRPDRPEPDRLVVRRFDRLCRFLAENRDKFRTAGFADLTAGSVPTVGRTTALRSAPYATLSRVVEQFVRRVV